MFEWTNESVIAELFLRKTELTLKRILEGSYTELFHFHGLSRKLWIEAIDCMRRLLWFHLFLLISLWEIHAKNKRKYYQCCPCQNQPTSALEFTHFFLLPGSSTPKMPQTLHIVHISALNEIFFLKCVKSFKCIKKKEEDKKNNTMRLLLRIEAFEQ